MLKATETLELKLPGVGSLGLAAPKSPTGRAAGVREDNKLRLHDRAAHQWYRFVLSFPPHLVRDYASKFGLDSRHRVLDPFCGTGTTVVECKKLGIPAFGLESNPVACFASRTKLQWNVEPQELLRHARMVADTASSRLERDGYYDDDDSLRLLDRPTAAKAPLRTLPEEAAALLLTNSISPVPLHKTLVLLDALAELHDDRFSDHERLALAAALVNGISNLHFGPEVGVGPAKADAPVVSLWLDGIRAMAQDLENLPPDQRAEAVIYQADAREAARVLPPRSVDAVITSPPYPNEKDYTRTTRLESVLLGFIQSKEDLRDLKRRLVRSNTRGVYKARSIRQATRNGRVSCNLLKQFRVQSAFSKTRQLRCIMRTKPLPSLNQNQLVCPECGNRNRFVEVMAEETHLVDGSRTYIRLLDGVVDRYLCWDCSATIELKAPPTA